MVAIDGSTALSRATEEGHAAIVQLLRAALKRGTLRIEESVELTDAVHSAADGWHLRLTRAVAAAATKAIVTMRVAGMARGGAYKPTVVAAAMAPVPSLNEAAVADAASTEATRTGKASRQALVAEVEQVVAQEMETVTAVTLGTYKEKEADVAVAAAWAIGP
jgi:hypothetical protein